MKTGIAYLTASVVIAAAAAVYGLFSHGVYSYYMTYAFMIPLLGGAVPHLIAAMKSEKTTDAAAEISADEALRSPERENPLATVKTVGAKDMQLALISTLTAGSLLKGVLDIYGTSSRLMIVYPATAAVIIAAALAMILKKQKNN